MIFGEKTAQVGGVKPGGGLFWLTAWRERVDHAWTRVQRKLGFAPDTDADGVVEIELTEKIPTLSTWIVVDLNTSSLDVDLAEAQKFDGQSFDVVAPSAFEVRPMTVEMKEEGEATSHFEVLGADIEVVWLRPQVGAWRARILDGGAADLDGIGDRRLRFDASAFQAVFPERLDPPEAPQAGDVLLGIEANSLRAFVAQVEK